MMMFEYFWVLCALLYVSQAKPRNRDNGPACPGNKWTQWYDRDDPSVTGDYETLKDLRNERPAGEICAMPTAVEAVQIDGSPITDQVTVSPSLGLICLRSLNGGSCEDYKVRFCCPEGNAPICPSQKWTAWYDRDQPGGTGDFELLGNLRDENPGEICEDPTDIEATLLDGTSYVDAGKNVIVSPDIGLICRKNENSGTCSDFRVRFCCPKGPRRKTSGGGGK